MAESNAEEHSPTERELRLLNRKFMKNLSDLNRAVKYTSNPNLEQAKTLFGHVDQCYTDLIKMINSKKKN